MKEKYRKDQTTVSMVNYHLVFCPRYRRKIFLIDGVEARFKELARQICEQNEYDILSIECDADCCHLYVNVLPNASPHDVIKAIKGATSSALRKEFNELSQMQNLWTRCYFASTEETVSKDAVEAFVKSQKIR